MPSNKPPFFSAVMPLYNKAPHVKRSVGSVLAQTFSDFELIVVDDSSTDESVEEVKTFSDTRLRLIRGGGAPEGPGPARNRGIREAAGKWIAFLDADDRWETEHLLKMKELSGLFPDVSFLSCGWVNCNGSSMEEEAYYKENKDRGPHIINLEEYLRQNIRKRRPVCTSVACVSRGIPGAQELFQTERGSDIHAWLKLLCRFKKMAWSSHAGAVYFRDSVNMVTKTIRATPKFSSREVYKELSKNLNRKEKTLLKKYFNHLLCGAWKTNIVINENNFSLIDKLYWKEDFLKSIYMCLISLFPNKFLRATGKSKLKLKKLSKFFS
jgi:glycosyltransferase involved in cell wall biosynthesis